MDEDSQTRLTGVLAMFQGQELAELDPSSTNNFIVVNDYFELKPPLDPGGYHSIRITVFCDAERAFCAS